MSRWTTEFEKHPIHETVKQTTDWASTEFEDVDSEHEAEQRRLLKVLSMISDVIAGTDKEFFPEQEFTQLNNHMRQQNFWNQLSSYSSSGNARHLRNSNDHMNNQIPRIYQIAGLAKKPETNKAIQGAEKAYDNFVKSIEKVKKDFDSKLGANSARLSELEVNAEELKTAHEQMLREKKETIGRWQAEFGNAQTTRNDEHSEAQKARATEFEETLDNMKSAAKLDRDQISERHNKALEETFSKFSEVADEKQADIEKKHQSILHVHDIVAGDGVAGGYKKTAKEEGDAANRWRNIAMASFVAAAVWTLVKVAAYWKGWVSTTPGNFDWTEVIAATSLTLILLATAAYAAAQSKLHRVNEQQMSWFSLEVGALDPFIASLTEDQQRVLKIQLSQRLFGQNRMAAASEVDAGENGMVKTVLDAVTKLGGKGE